MTYTDEIDNHNETVLEAQEADFFTFLADEDWRNADEIVQNLWDLGKDAKAEELRRAYLRAQTEVSLRNDGLITVRPEQADFSAKRMMNNILWGDSELNPNRGDAPY